LEPPLSQLLLHIGIIACAPFAQSTNCLTLKSAYENSEISKNLNVNWNNRTGAIHNPILLNAAQPGTQIAPLL